jgi:hypothetical protein
MKKTAVYHRRWQRIAVLLFSGLLYCGTTMSVLGAQSPPKSSSSKRKIKPPELPRDTGKPDGARRGGASRSNDTCPRVKVPLTALVPAIFQRKNGKVVEYVWGLTTAEKPSFWLYSPYENGDRYRTTFVIRQQNKNGESLGTIPAKLPSRPGVFKIELPAELTGLQLNQRYYWELSIDCEQASDAVPIKVYGIIQRTELPADVMRKIQASTTAIEKAKQYADNGILFDALDLLTTGYQNNPEDKALKESWQDLIKSIELDPKLLESQETAKLGNNLFHSFQ